MFSKTITPIFCDTDALGHISNTTIPRWLESARDPIFQLFTPDMDPKNWALIIAKYEINFIAELFYGKDVEIRTPLSKMGNSSLHVRQEIWQTSTLAIKGLTILIHFDYKSRKSLPIPTTIREKLLEHLQT